MKTKGQKTCQKENKLSKSHQRRLDRALILAENSTCKQRHGAIIVRGGRTLSVGINTYRMDPHTIVDEIIVKDFSWHAEVAAIRAYKGDLTGATLYVARLSRRGEAAMSKPCINCQKAIKDAGIKKVFYTIDEQLDF